MSTHNKVVVVEWGDAFIDTEDFDIKKAKNTKPIWRRTVGFLVAENDWGLVLATDEYHRRKDGVAAKMFVPWGMINEWWYLEQA